MAKAAHVGIWVDGDAILIWPECAKLCEAFGLNPLGTIASGALLIALSPQQTPALLAAYEKAYVPCAVIGRVTSTEEGLKLKSGALITDLPRFDQDEITKLF